MSTRKSVVQSAVDQSVNPVTTTEENMTAQLPDVSATNPAESAPKLTPLGLARLAKAHEHYANKGGPKPLEIANLKVFGALADEYGTSVVESRAKIFGPTVTADAVKGWMQSFANLPMMYREIVAATTPKKFRGFTGKVVEYVDETTDADGEVMENYRGFVITSADVAAVAELPIDQQIEAIAPNFPLNAVTDLSAILDWLKSSALYKPAAKDTPMALWGILNTATERVHLFFASADCKFDNLYYLVNFADVTAENFANLPAHVQRDFAAILNKDDAAK
jgi:hypothetical protein